VTDNRFADDPLARWVQDAMKRSLYVKACDGEAMVLMTMESFSRLVQAARARQEPPKPSVN
jgi:hypothetical protein